MSAKGELEQRKKKPYRCKYVSSRQYQEVAQTQTSICSAGLADLHLRQGRPAGFRRRSATMAVDLRQLARPQHAGFRSVRSVRRWR